jgi:hypothetical protein
MNSLNNTTDSKPPQAKANEPIELIDEHLNFEPSTTAPTAKRKHFQNHDLRRREPLTTVAQDLTEVNTFPKTKSSLGLAPKGRYIAIRHRAKNQSLTNFRQPAAFAQATLPIVPTIWTPRSNPPGTPFLRCQ